MRIRSERGWRRAAGACGLALLAAAAPAAGAGEFEVLVVRGSAITRVTGDARGPLSEETLREDPTPARPQPPAARPFEPDVVIRIEPGETPAPAPVAPAWRYPLPRPLLRETPPRTHLHDWGARHQHGGHRLGGRPPRSALPGGPRGVGSR